MTLTINEEAARRLQRYAVDGETASQTGLRATREATKAGRYQGRLKAERAAHRATRAAHLEAFLVGDSTPRATYRRLTGRWPEEG